MQWNMDHSRHNIENVAAGYDALPTYDPKAKSAWKTLANESKSHADFIRKHLNVSETDNPEPYNSSEQMINDIRNNRNFSVSTANSEHPIWTPEENVNFRIVHDVFGHGATEGNFGWHGENDACSTHFGLSSPEARKALATECLGQTGYAINRGNFTDQKVGFIPGLHEGLTEANKDAPVPTREQLMQRVLKGPEKTSKWKIAANPATEKRIQNIIDMAKSKGLEVNQSNDDGHLMTSIDIGKMDEYASESMYVVWIYHGKNTTRSVAYDRPESLDYRTNLATIEKAIESIEPENFNERAFQTNNEGLFNGKNILWNRYSTHGQRALAIGDSAVETTFNAVPETHDPSEDEEIQIVDGKKKKWKMVRPKDHKGEDASYAGPENKSGWGFYSHFDIDALIAQYETKLSKWHKIGAAPLDSNKEYEIPWGHSVIQELKDHFAPIGLIPITSYGDSRKFPLTEQPAFDNFRNHRIDLYDPEHKEKVYGINYKLNHPDKYQHRDKYGQLADPEDRYPTYVDSIHFYDKPSQDFPDSPNRFYLSEIDEKGNSRPEEPPGDDDYYSYENRYNEIQERHPHAAKRMLSWMAKNLPRPFGANIVNPKLKEKALKHNYVSLSKWKLSVPPADQAKEFSEGFEQAEVPEELKHKYPVRGHRWELDAKKLERLYNHPQWPLETPYYVQALSKEDIGRPRGVNSMDEWSSLMGEHHSPGEIKAGLKSGAIFINPLLSPEAANEALWHELQHAYQHQEKRWQEHKNDYVNPLELQNRGLSDEEKKEKTKQYYKHPMELDANEFADYMRKHPLISESEPHYNPNWVPEEQRHAAQELIDQYYAEHGSKHRLRLPSLKDSKWKKISIGLWDPENTDSSHYFETKVVEEIPISVAMQMLDVERGKEDYESSNIENLVKNISQSGFLNPIIIDYNINDNTAFISEGNHRVQAAKQLGMEWIPARGVRNYGQKSRFKELPVQWQGIQEDYAGDLYIPPNFPPHMIGIPVKEKVKGFEDGENYNGWETKESKWKIAGETKTKLLQRAEDLNENYTDTSDIVHKFDDGWTIRRINTIGDAHREGQLMGNCLTHEGDFCPPFANVAAKIDPNFSIENHQDFPWEDYYDEEIRDEREEIHSLRDPDNIPHATYDSAFSSDGGFDSPLLGRHNDLLKPQYRPYWDEWFAKNNKSPFPWSRWDSEHRQYRQSNLTKEAPARSKAQFRYMQGICNGSIEPPDGMTKAQACEYVAEQKDYKNLPDKASHLNPVQKLAKKKELQDKLIDCGFSLKAASSIALQEISQKYSYWVDGYNAVVGMRDPETGQWHMDVGSDTRLTHGAVTSDYINDLGTPSMRNMIKDKESRTDYYHNHTARGLYNPKTKDFIHFSYPDQYDFSVYGEQIEKFWRDLAEQNGIVVDTLRILNDQSGHFEDINVSDLEMPEEIREQMAKKNLTLKTLDERVDRVRELEAEGLSSSEALNKMTLEEWELKYKKEFERGGKYVYASKWKIVAKGYVTKRSNFINHRRVGFIPGKMIHHKHYSDLKGHQKAVQHYGPLKTHNVRNFKKESVLNEDQAQELFGQQPYMYHDVAAARTKKGNNSQIPIINSIFKNGILPKEQTGVSEYDDWLTSRPEHVYLGEERFYPKNAVPALRIDMSKVDPHTLAPDEDLFPVYGYNNQQAHRLDFNDIKSPPFEKEHPEGATLGNWAHEHSHLDTPKNVRASKELMGSISVNGGVPADASHFNPPWLDKVEFDIRENMEDPEADLEDDRHLMDLILSNQERISEDGDSDYLSRMMDLYNELYEEVQKRKEMYKKQSKWKLSNVQFEIDGNHIYAIVNNKIVGDLEFINYDDDFEDNQTVEIEFIRVDRQYRRTGIGKLLLEKLYNLYPNHEFQTTGVTPLGEKLINSFERDFGIDVDYWGEAPPEFPDEIPNKNSKWKIAKPNLVPSEGVRSAARRGIKYHAEGKAGDGFEAATLDRAHKIANGEELTPEHVKRMHSFFERHAGGRSQKAKKGEITPWDVAWLAWGGTAGRSWAASKVKELENSEKTSKKKCECWEGYKRVPGTKPCEPGSCEKCDKAHKQSKWKIADHDYDPEWDYELEEDPQKIQQIQNIINQHLPKIQSYAKQKFDISTFQIHFVKNLGKGHVARYISGTSSDPVVVIDIDVLLSETENIHHSTYEIQTTIIHELAHAYEEKNELEHNEDFAEDKGQSFHLGKWKIANHQGWTNYETWNVNAMMLNDYELNKHFHNLVVNKASGNQFIADAIGLVIGPHNKQLQEDFSSMSDDEEVEMQKQNQQEDWWRNAEKQHPDDYLAQEAYVRQMKEITMTFMGEPQPTDIADYWIDESKVNWKEIYNYWKSNAEAEGNQIISKWKISGFDENVWYHTTSIKNLQSIRDHGLAPRELYGQGSNFSGSPVSSKGTYLWPNASSAANYASSDSMLLKNTGLDSNQFALLRIKNIDVRRILPDHETLAHIAENEGENWIRDNLSNEFSPDAIELEDVLQVLENLPISKRQDLIKFWSNSFPTEPVFYVGTIPAQNIDIMNTPGSDEGPEAFDESRYKDLGGSEYGFEDYGDESANLFKYRPMFGKWKSVKI